MESFACLIQTHTGQDKEGTERGRDRKRERGEREGCRETDRKRVEEEQEREITETGRQGGENERVSGKRLLPHHPPPHVCIYQKNRQY